MIEGVDADVAVELLIIGDGIWEYLSPFLMDFIWPFTVDSERGGYFETCCNVITGNVVMYPASIDLASVWSIVKIRKVW